MARRASPARFVALEIAGQFYVAREAADYSVAIEAPVDMISAFNHRQSADFLAAGLSKLANVRTMRIQTAKLRAFRAW